MNQPSSQDPASPQGGGVARMLPLAGVIVLALTLVGFLKGIAEPEAATAESTSPASRSVTGDVAHAVAYRDLAAARLSPNADFHSSLDALRFEKPSIFDPVERTPEMKIAALIDRTRTRAFDGAPPVIPHTIEQQSAASCLACHGQGIRMGDRIATKVSHSHYTSCTQCHVASRNGGPFEAPQPVENEFAGIQRSGPGERACVGAPPTIPHSLWLRNDCTSCHGLVARPGLRTTHPWLSNCVQCHVESNNVPRVSDAGFAAHVKSKPD
jgi:cytochrome c-type protein NapB